ncbi:MAG TPA: ABC transporter ATP-binding protein [Kofleriaceae bacterium]|jgi:ABC-type lipoprotein export system ATPase subunit|nr:ABC transporter ATP-binding protein [Kofleriaceae bacterium]
MPIIELTDVTRRYQMGDVTVHALGGVSLGIDAGDFVAIMGASGSGKSTLMNIIGCLDRPTSGRYFLAGREVSRLDPDQLAEIRNHFIGFVFQRCEPKVILADEPTGNLDSRTSLEIIALFQELGRSGITVVLVTHEQDVAEHASRVVVVKDGRIQSDERRIPVPAAVPPLEKSA